MKISNILYHFTSPRSLSAGISYASLAYQAFQAARPHLTEISNYFCPQPRETRSKIHGNLDFVGVLDMQSATFALIQLGLYYGSSYSHPTLKHQLVLAGLTVVPAVAALPILRGLNHLHWNRYCGDISALRSETIGEDVTISWNRPSEDKWLQGFLIANAAYHFGLAKFSRFKLLSGMTAVLSLYRLYRITQQRWVKYEVNVPTPLYQQLNKIRFSILLGLVPLQSPSDDNCMVCQYAAPSHYFCEHHALHSSCMIDWINSKKNDMFNPIQVSRITYTDGSCKYCIKIPQSNLPGCPAKCGTLPIFSVEATVYEGDRPQDTNVILTDVPTNNQG